MSRKSTLWIVVLAGYLGTGAPARAADEARINAAIGKGQGYLSSKLKEMNGPNKSLAAYALLKSGLKSNPDIQEAVELAVKEATEHYSPGMPRFGHEFAYTVPCHMFLLDAADPVANKAALEAMAGYLVEHQQENGSWFYTMVPSSDACDTSQAQFALLGLWAATRAGVDVPVEAFQKAGHWFLQSQREDGGFAYQPHPGAQPHERLTTLSTTLAGTGSLLLVRQIFYPGSTLGDELSQMAKPKKKKHGVLERLQDEQERQRKTSEINIPVAALDKAVSRAMKVVDSRFSTSAPFQMYLMYSMERSAALLDSDTLGKHDWYEETSNALLQLQLADGSWSDKAGAVPATSFALLCLGRATAQTLNKTKAPGKIGGGLLAGARGLPEDLSKLHLKDGQAVARKSKGDVDDLLAELEKTADVSVADVQKAILESVNLDDKDQLVGQLDRLRRLAVDPRAEVRRTAFWAIGRSREVRMAPLLIAGLKDEDIDVMREASYGLTVLSRKPTGLVDDQGKLVPVEPLDGIDEDVPDEERQQHLEQWYASAAPAWKKWYLSVRSYGERDDRQTLQKKR